MNYYFSKINCNLLKLGVTPLKDSPKCLLDVQNIRKLVKNTIKNIEEKSKYYINYKNIINCLRVIEKNILYKADLKKIKKLENVYNPLFFNFMGECNLLSHELTFLESIVINMGFIKLNSKHIVNSYINFDILLTKRSHVSRNLENTFYISNKSHKGVQRDFLNVKLLLRTHTTTSWNEAVFKYSKVSNILSLLPIKHYSIGTVFRCDYDKTHLPWFNQCDLYVINIKDINVNYLVCLAKYIIMLFFNDDNIKLRVRSSYFPFTIPSFEIDIFNNGIWVEIAGLGMIKEKFLNNISCDNLKGVAIGFGVERMVMLKHNISDIKYLYGMYGA